jgi:gluconolactonase
MRKGLIAALACLSMLGIMHASRAADAEVVAKNLQFPEGTIFVGDTLYFVDYSTSDVLRLVGGPGEKPLETRVETVWHQDGCGANGLVAVPDGLWVACYDSNTIVRISKEGKLLETIDKDDAGQPFLYPNDLAADAKGGVYFSGSGSEANLGKVYYLTASHRVEQVAADFHYSNGLVVSLDGKLLYVNETRAGRILRFTIAPDGTLSNRQQFVKLSDILGDAAGEVYSPDGVRIDKHGNLFVGLYDGGGFAVISPDGKLIAQVPLPGQHHANLAISPDGKFVYSTGFYDTSINSYRGQLFRVRNPVAE